MEVSFIYTQFLLIIHFVVLRILNFSFGYSAFGNFADQQYFTVVLRISKRKKKDEIQTNQCIALTGQLKHLGNDEECQLTVTATLPPSPGAP